MIAEGRLSWEVSGVEGWRIRRDENMLPIKIVKVVEERRCRYSKRCGGEVLEEEVVRYGGQLEEGR